jgi:hypothetical protein
MTPRRLIERLIYIVLIILGLIAIGLVLASPPDFVKNKVVYGGF